MLAIIGGSGLTQLANLNVIRREVVRTPYGEPSGALTFGQLCEHPVVFLARHGYGHTIPPHRVNYQANLWALKEARAEVIISVASVGHTPAPTVAPMAASAGWRCAASTSVRLAAASITRSSWNKKRSA